MKSTRAVLYHNLANLLDAGVPLLRSVVSCSAGLNNKLARQFPLLAETIHTGNTLAEAMRRHPKHFGRLDIITAEVGETSGRLPQALHQLADWYFLTQRLRGIIISGLLLPILLVHIAAILVPLPRFILGQSNLTQYLCTVILALLPVYLVIFAVFAIRRFTPETGPLRRVLEGALSLVPVLRKGLRDLALSRYNRAFHMLFSAGVSGIQAAELAVDCTGNALIARRLRGAAESARQGNLFCEGFDPRLPVEFRESWCIGEESGSLDITTQRLADNYAESAETLLKEFARWLPRIIYFIIMIMMAAAILKLAAGTLIPQLPE
jgi:type IV pilus assembly protein PilC